MFLPCSKITLRTAEWTANQFNSRYGIRLVKKITSACDH